MASIPNVRYIGVLIDLLYRKEWKYIDHGVMDRTHLRFYTEKSIRRMFDECGYKVQEIKGIHSVSKFSMTAILNLIFFKRFDDVKYRQFLIVAVPK